MNHFASGGVRPVQLARIAVYLLTPVLVLGFTSCDDEEDDKPSDPWQGGSTTQIVERHSAPSIDSCESYSGKSYSYYHEAYFNSSTEVHCYEKEDRQWTTRCPSWEKCSSTKVYVHYMIAEELGEGFTVHVEAFDNKQFRQAPVATAELSPFKATQGRWQETNLHLPTGEYYLRAFLSTDEEVIKPYQFGNMKLVAEQPLGVYGALSSPKRLVVNGSNNDPVHINLDKLFKDPTKEPDTNARMRFVLTVDDPGSLQSSRKVIVQLHESSDFEAKPLYESELLTDLFQTSAQPGRAEVITDSLDVGSYFVHVFYDANANNFYDEGELHATLLDGELAKSISVQKDHTRTVPLTLSP